MAIYCPECGKEIKEGETCGCAECNRRGSKPVRQPGASDADAPAVSGGLNIGLGILIMLLCVALIWPAGVTAAYKTILGWLPEAARDSAEHVPAWKLAITVLGLGIIAILFRLNRPRR